EIIEHEWAKARAKNPEVIMRRPCAGRNRRKRETANQCCDRLLRDLGIDKKMSKEELIQFEGLVIEILPDARYRVQLDAGYEVLGLHGRPPEIGARSLGVQTILSGRFQGRNSTLNEKPADRGPVTFDYSSPAELFMGKRKGGARQPLRYRRFATAAEAIRFAIEELPAVRALGAWMQ